MFDMWCLNLKMFLLPFGLSRVLGVSNSMNPMNPISAKLLSMDSYIQAEMVNL